MKSTKKTILLLIVLILSSIAVGQTEESALRTNFKNPPLKHRMNINQHLLPVDSLEADKYIDEWLIENGYGGINTNVFPTNYLESEKNFASFCRSIRYAKQKGFDIWLYDEKLYPSGMADNKILQDNPEWEAEGLLIYKNKVEANQTVEKQMPGSLVLAKAIPIINSQIAYSEERDISHSFDNGILKWTPSEGVWIIVLVTQNVLYEGYQSHTERGGEHPRYPSLLMPEVSNLFIDYTHKRYEKNFGEKLGNYFTATFTDEPSTMALPYQEFGYGVYPWKQHVSDEFEKRYGYSLTEKLVKITLDDTGEGQLLRCQYFQLIGEMMSQNYLKTIKDYCHQQGFLSSGHFLLEESLVAHVPLYGDIMACFREMDIPGVDALTGITSKTRSYLLSTRMASSVAELNGNFRVMYESCPIDNDLPDMEEPSALDVKGVHNRVMLAGVTDFNNYLRLTHESPAGRTAFNEYTARVVSALYGGVRAARIAIYYPIETLWTKFKPDNMRLKTWWSVMGAAPEAQSIEDLVYNITYSLTDNGWEYSYIDAQGLIESQAQAGTLTHKNHLKWDVVILPSVETIPDAAYKKLIEFIECGGKLIVFDKLPVNSTTDFPSANISNRFKDYAERKKITYNSEFSSNSLNLQLENILKREITMNQYEGMMHCHRVIGGKDIFFIINDEKKDKTISISLPENQEWELWDPQTGDITSIPSSFEHKFTTFESIILRSK